MARGAMTSLINIPNILLLQFYPFPITAVHVRWLGMVTAISAASTRGFQVVVVKMRDKSCLKQNNRRKRNNA